MSLKKKQQNKTIINIIHFEPYIPEKYVYGPATATYMYSRLSLTTTIQPITRRIDSFRALSVVFS